MSELPCRWANTTFQVLFKRLQYGLTAKANSNVSGVRFLRITDLQNYTIDWRLVPGLVDGTESNHFLLSHGDFVFARSGSVEKAARVEHPPTAVFASYLIRGTPELPETSDWLAKFIRSTEYLNQVRDRAAGIGMSNVSAAKFASIAVPLPPLEEQQRIVAKTDSLSAKSGRARNHLDHLPRLVAKYKQAVLTAAFRGDLTREWRAASLGSQDASQFISERLRHFEALRTAAGRGRDEKSAQIALDEELRNEIGIMSSAEPLPSGWHWASLGLAFGVYVGATPSRKQPELWGGSLPWASSGEVAFCRIGQTHETITDLGLKNTSTRLHPPGTLLIGMIGEGKTRGQTAILDVEAANNQNCAAVRVREAGYCPEYIYWYFWMSYERTRTVGAGNNQPALNKDRVQRLLVPLAPPLEAFEVARRIEIAFKWIDRLAGEATSARTLVDHLDQAVLAKAFRGELVPQDPADEPASVLLERIRAERVTTRQSASARGRPSRSVEDDVAV